MIFVLRWSLSAAIAAGRFGSVIKCEGASLEHELLGTEAVMHLLVQMSIEFHKFEFLKSSK